MAPYSARQIAPPGRAGGVSATRWNVSSHRPRALRSLSRQPPGVTAKRERAPDIDHHECAQGSCRKRHTNRAASPIPGHRFPTVSAWAVPATSATIPSTACRPRQGLVGHSHPVTEHREHHDHDHGHPRDHAGPGALTKEHHREPVPASSGDRQGRWERCKAAGAAGRRAARSARPKRWKAMERSMPIRPESARNRPEEKNCRDIIARATIPSAVAASPQA